MKRKLLLLLFLFSVLTEYAENITIKQKSGNETILELSTNPVITFSDENMVVTNDFTTITFPLDDIDGYIVGNSTEIQEVSNTPHYYNGHIVFNGIKKGVSASVYSFDGKFISKFSADSSGILDINIGSFPKGAYIISTPNNIIKVINK